MKNLARSSFLLTLLTAVLLLLWSGQASAAPPIIKTQSDARIETNTIEVEGRTRRYYLYTPNSYRADRPAPLIMAFHGYLGSGPQMMRMTELNALADREGVLVVYPNAVRDRWHTRSAPSDATDEDVRFVDLLISRIQRERNVDATRIYATGFSNGGFFTHRLACELSDKIAAFAPVAATIGVPLTRTCQANRPIPMLIINGTDDPIVTWEGQFKRVRYAFRDSDITSVPQSVDFWRKRNHCGGSPHVTLLLKAPAEGEGAQLNAFPDCEAPAEVAQVIIQKGGHTWPGTPIRARLGRFLLGRPNLEVNANELMWTFFQRHPLPQRNPTAD